jgi:hypothetical protein
MLYSPIQVILATLHALYDVGEDCGKHKVGPSVGAGGKSEFGGGGRVAPIYNVYSEVAVED